MAQRRTTRTIHTFTIDLQDDMLAGVDTMGDEVEVVLVSRVGQTLPKKLSQKDLFYLLEGRGR
jgi:hypothetical protein